MEDKTLSSFEMTLFFQKYHSSRTFYFLIIKNNFVSNGMCAHAWSEYGMSAYTIWRLKVTMGSEQAVRHACELLSHGPPVIQSLWEFRHGCPLQSDHHFLHQQLTLTQLLLPLSLIYSLFLISIYFLPETPIPLLLPIHTCLPVCCQSYYIF